MFLSVQTRNGIQTHSRGGFTFGPEPKVVRLDDTDKRAPCHPKNRLRREQLERQYQELLKKEADFEERTKGRVLNLSDQTEQKRLAGEYETLERAIAAVKEDDRAAPSSTGGGAARLKAIMEDSEAPHGALLVHEITEAEAKRLLEKRPELDAVRVPPDVAAEMEAMRARLVELDAELAEMRGRAPAPPPTANADGAPSHEPDGPDRAGRERVGRKR